jgi:hypothetical protein
VKTLLKAHRFLSLFVAPAMIFFAVSGALQSYRLQEDRKDGSYHAPQALKTMGEIHKAERLPPAGKPVFRAAQLVLAAVFLATALAGVAIGFRTARSAWPIWAALLAGTALPLVVVLATRT